MHVLQTNVLYGMQMFFQPKTSDSFSQFAHRLFSVRSNSGHVVAKAHGTRERKRVSNREHIISLRKKKKRTGEL